MRRRRCGPRLARALRKAAAQRPIAVTAQRRPRRARATNELDPSVAEHLDGTACASFAAAERRSARAPYEDLDLGGRRSRARRRSRGSRRCGSTTSAARRRPGRRPSTAAPVRRRPGRGPRVASNDPRVWATNVADGRRDRSCHEAMLRLTASISRRRPPVSTRGNGPSPPDEAGPPDEALPVQRRRT